MTNREKELDRILQTSTRSEDVQIEGLARTADDLTRELAVPAPINPRTRTMFIEGVAARHRPIFSSLLAPGIAVVGLLVVIALLGRGALPGETLYPVRKVLGSAGLASAPFGAVEAHLEEVDDLVDRADDALDDGRAVMAEALAVSALKRLGEAEAVLGEFGPDNREDLADEIADLQEEALIVLRLASDQDTLDEDDDSSGQGDSGDDSSGPGSGDDSGDDSSGPGSGDDSGDDSSGPGSGDPDSDDSSGPGSGDDSGGHGDSGSGSDNSGSG